MRTLDGTQIQEVAGAATSYIRAPIPTGTTAINGPGGRVLVPVRQAAGSRGGRTPEQEAALLLYTWLLNNTRGSGIGSGGVPSSF
jgi:hypothetical protein